jgi:predicted nucleic acid-binding protein
MIVVDASALAELFREGPATPAVEAHLAGEALAAPHILDLEVLHFLRRSLATGRLSAERVQESVLELLDMTILRFPHEILIPRIWFLRDNFTPYDAAYLALAESLTDDGVPLLTADVRFARAARKHGDAEVLLAA